MEGMMSWHSHTPHYSEMSHREDFYSKEATLINNAKRELTDGREKEPIHKLRLLCFSRGATGILGLAKTFRNMNIDDNAPLGLSEFINGVRDCGLDCTEKELKEMFACFDSDGCGSITMPEFLAKIRPNMSNSRMAILDKAFAKMDHEKEGAITPEAIRNVYSVRDHPKYKSGQMTESEILTQFLNNFDGGRGDKNGKITKEEFINYYSTISASIDTDAYFDLVMRQAYKL